MTLFIGSFDAPAIVLNHCRGSGQKFSLEPVEIEPKKDPELKYVDWLDLNRNHVGNLNPGDIIFWKDSEGVCWRIKLYQFPRPVDRSGLEAIMRLDRTQKRKEGKGRFDEKYE